MTTLKELISNKIRQSPTGSLQVSEITNLINKDDQYVTRNTINTIIYSNLDNKGDKLFIKTGYGRFSLKNGNINGIKDSILNKLINLMFKYQEKFNKLGIDYNTKKFDIYFDDDEIEYMTNILRGKKK